MKGEVLGNHPGEVQETTFLGRTIRYTNKGYEYEGHQKHVRILIKEWDMEDCKSLSSPGAAAEKASPKLKAEEEQELGVAEAKIYRRAAARINYMALDRADLSFASKEASRGMAKPTVGDVVRLKRILRYLKGSPRVVNRFIWQDPQSVIAGYSDSDWAGCVKTRKSTSGGFLMIGCHMITHWSSTQSIIALSSAEAELNALIKLASEALGIQNTLKEHGQIYKIVALTDSSASDGMLHREGCGKVKHLETRQLWLQGHVAEKKVEVKKIPREINCSDCLTHHWTNKDCEKHFKRVGLMWR